MKTLVFSRSHFGFGINYDHVIPRVGKRSIVKEKFASNSDPLIIYPVLNLSTKLVKMS